MQQDFNAMIQQFKDQLLKQSFTGEFHDDYPTRLLNATDNSIYELLPLAVAQPQNVNDLQKLIILAKQNEFKSLKFSARGGGTGTNGQSLTNSIVIDLSKFMNKVIDFDPQNHSITVEPGIILADLNRFLLTHGLFFAPNVSTENRATIGGMIATDAAGKGSLIYGKTSDYILATTLILADGQIIESKKLSLTEIDKLAPQHLGQICQQIMELLKPVQEEIYTRFPPLKRPLSGYNIKQCYAENSFDLNRLIAGSEGTLAILAKAQLKLLPIPKHKALVVVHYPSFLAALQDAAFLIKYQPLAIEAIDEKVQKSAQTLPNWPILAKLLNSENQNYISNFIEFTAETTAELEKKLILFEHDLKQKQANFVIITDPNHINLLWSIRSLAVGLVGKMTGDRKPVAFVEDAIVPPEHLSSFVADLQEELTTKQLNYAMYGHVDVGCIHVRPALNMQDYNDRQKIRPITESVIRLLDKYNGVLWGEHGKGFRGEFVPHVFGPILYPILCKIKALFDPENRFNPGKLANPNNSPLQRIEKVPMRGEFDQIIPAVIQQEFSDAMLCNGNAACFNKEPSNVMCPSYKVTNDRIHSPKGRAMLVKEWLRESAKTSSYESKLAAMTFAAMNGCLGCKGCAGKCPTQVSIPDLRTTFLNNYHQKYKRRSLRDFALGHIEHILPIIAKFPRIVNYLGQTKLTQKFGFGTIPKFNTSWPLNSQLNALKVKYYSKSTTYLENNSVVIFIDVFNGFLDQQILISAIQIFKHLGYIPYVIAPRISGKALIVGGFINKFKQNALKLAQLFDPLFALNIPIVSLENTITSMFRDEVNKFAIPFKGKVLSLAEFINKNQDKLSKIIINSKTTSSYCLLPHCTEQAIMPLEAKLWQEVFSLCNHKLEVNNLGCCGMAGSYGYQHEHQEHSKDLFKLHWQSQLVTDTQMLATGFSCRAQSVKLINKTIKHPVEIILSWLEN